MLLADLLVEMLKKNDEVWEGKLLIFVIQRLHPLTVVDHDRPIRQICNCRAVSMERYIGLTMMSQIHISRRHL